MIAVAYLREGRVHASHEAYEGGDSAGKYQTIMDLDGNNEITATIDGRRYRSLWCWPVDSARPYGAVPLIRIDERKSND